MFIDSHAHIDITSDQKRFMDFDKKKHLIPIELSDLFPPDLDYVVHISLNPFDFLKNYPIFKQYPKMLYATGIYPDHAAIKDFDEDHYIAELKKVLLEYPHIALGEAGIDLKNDSYGTLSQQESLLHKQVALAEDLNLPIIIHSRCSFRETYNVLKDYKTKAIIHCFSYGIKEAEEILERGDIISFAGQLSYKNTLELHAVAQMVPLESLLFETDSPYLTPTPFRGKWNVPANVEHTYRFFAQLRDIPLEILCDQVKVNFENIFLKKN